MKLSELFGILADSLKIVIYVGYENVFQGYKQLAENKIRNKKLDLDLDALEVIGLGMSRGYFLGIYTNPIEQTEP